MNQLQQRYATPVNKTGNFDLLLAAEMGDAIAQLCVLLGIGPDDLERAPTSYCALKLVSGVLLFTAKDMGCTNFWDEFCAVAWKNDLPTRRDLRSIQNIFNRLNSEVWPREQTFEPETPENAKWRELGKAMHLHYEVIKRVYMLAGGDLEVWRKHDAMRAQFSQIFVEGLERAAAGEPIAIAFMRDHWGVMF